LQENKLDFDARPVPSRHLTELLSRALLDQLLCDRLLADPEAIGRAFDLPPAEVEAIKLLDRRKFEAAIAKLRWGWAQLAGVALDQARA
jgi:hypothetical protein